MTLCFSKCTVRSSTREHLVTNGGPAGSGVSPRGWYHHQGFSQGKKFMETWSLFFRGWHGRKKGMKRKQVLSVPLPTTVGPQLGQLADVENQGPHSQRYRMSLWCMCVSRYAFLWYHYFSVSRIIVQNFIFSENCFAILFATIR